MFECIGFILQNQNASSAGEVFVAEQIFCVLRVKTTFLLKLINNVSKGTVQKVLHVTSVNQLRCLILTDTDKFIIVMLAVVV